MKRARGRPLGSSVLACLSAPAAPAAAPVFGSGSRDHDALVVASPVNFDSRLIRPVGPDVTRNHIVCLHRFEPQQGAPGSTLIDCFLGMEADCSGQEGGFCGC